MQTDITIKDYLREKGISFREANRELITKCLFASCDNDSRPNEGHLYFNAENGVYHCKKCDARGNLVTLSKHFGDDIKTTNYETEYVSKNSRKSRVLDPEMIKEYHDNLPLGIRSYLNERGIKDEIIDSYQIGYGEFYGKFWIVFPIKNIEGNYAFLKLKRLPGDTNNPDKGKVYLTGSSHQIYYWDDIKKAKEYLFIVEGEPDKLLLNSLGICAVTSTGGAETFKKQWVEEILKNPAIKKIYVCFDNDDSGRKGADKVINLVENGGSAVELYRITLPQEVGLKGDLTDYFIKLNGTAEDLFNKYAQKVFPKEEEKVPRIVKVELPEQPLSFEEWRSIISANFPELTFSAEVAMSILAQLLIPEITNPFALVLVDVPSAGKTITINFFSDIKELTYASDKFTPASFVSNATNVPKHKLKEVDLLPRLQYKMFLIRDLATLFSKRDDDLNECLGLLTRVLDGEGLNTDSGVHGQRQYTGEYLFMILAASTPIPPRVWKMMGNLGSRLFFLTMNARDKSEEELAHQLTTTTYKEKEKQCRIATRNFLYTLWAKHQDGIAWNKASDNEQWMLIIVRCAKLLAKLRGVINAWKDRSQEGEVYDYSLPVIEKPDRINQLFYNLCRGHALICGRQQINKEDLRLIIEIAIDSCPTVRASIFRKLLEHNGVLTTTQVMNALGYSRTTALKEMEVLKILGIVSTTQESHGYVGEPEKEIRLSEEFSWFLSDECHEIRGLSPLPKSTESAELIQEKLFDTPLSTLDSPFFN